MNYQFCFKSRVIITKPQLKISVHAIIIAFFGLGFAGCKDDLPSNTECHEYISPRSTTKDAMLPLFEQDTIEFNVITLEGAQSRVFILNGLNIDTLDFVNEDTETTIGCEGEKARHIIRITSNYYTYDHNDSIRLTLFRDVIKHRLIVNYRDRMLLHGDLHCFFCSKQKFDIKTSETTFDDCSDLTDRIKNYSVHNSFNSHFNKYGILQNDDFPNSTDIAYFNLEYGLCLIKLDQGTGSEITLERIIR